MKYLEVGKIIATHAIKGEVKVSLSTSFADERFKKGNVLYVYKDKKYEKIVIDSYRMHKGLALISFNGINNINNVLDYVDKTIYVDKVTLPELEEGHYYYDDLIGLKVYDKEELVGDVVDLLDVPQGSILVIKTLKGKESLVPYVKEFIKEVDLNNKKIVIESIEGLI